MEAIRTLARGNFTALSSNPYPGRWMILGRTPKENPVQIYAIMGRSPESQNRVFKEVAGENGRIETKFADESQATGNPSLLLYPAMVQRVGNYVVSNGSQTESVLLDGIYALDDWQYEPDSSSTPRIAGIIRYVPGDTFFMRLAIVRKSPFGDKKCDRHYYTYDEVAPGYGYFISTYEGDGKPLPFFQDEPLVMPIEDSDILQIAQTFWSALDEANRVALAVKVIEPDGSSKIRIINRFAAG